MNHNNLIRNFLTLAFDDYIDARLLIRQNRLLNGGHLSALAAEKVLKAVILACSLQPKPVHLNRANQLINPILESVPGYRNYINIEFLQYLGQIFSMRYYTDKTDEQISISRNKLLWEIDKFFDQIHDTLKFDPKEEPATYSKEKKLRNIMLCEDNQWLLGKHDIADLGTMPDFLEAIYRLDNGAWISVRKEFPNTFVNSKIGEELRFGRGDKELPDQLQIRTLGPIVPPKDFKIRNRKRSQ